MRFYKIKCKKAKEYEFIKRILKEQDIPFKQKEKNKPIKIKGYWFIFADTICEPLMKEGIHFTLYSIESKQKSPLKLISTEEDKSKSENYEREYYC